LGPILVGVSWVLVVGGLVALGLPFVLVGERVLNWHKIRVAIWVGLLFSVTAVVTTNLFMPLRSGLAAICMAGLLLLALAATFTLRPAWIQPRANAGSFMGKEHWAPALVAVTLVVGVGYLAIAALGPVTNYDSGLYHLGAIGYAGDFRTIPGLANLYQAFGYNNSIFPLAAFLGNGPWDGIGFRLVNGLLMVAMAADLLIRLVQRRKSVGTYVLLIGLAASWVPLIALSDYWVTSPSSDSAVMLLTLVALAYLADALKERRNYLLNAGVAFSCSTLAFSMRPTMAIFAVAVLIVIVVRALRLGGRVKRGRGFILVMGGIGISLAVIQSMRDYLLSGWLLYPLSLWSFNVPWLSIDPINSRAATLGTARDPSNYLEAANSWSWVGVWFSRLPLQWEFYELLSLVVFAVLLGIMARRLTGMRVLTRRLVLLMFPSAITVLVWWLASPPSFRFAWGPLFGLAVAPAGWFLFQLGQGVHGRDRVMPLISTALAVALLLLVAYCGVIRLDYMTMTVARSFKMGDFSVTYYAAPIPRPETNVRPMPSGLDLLTPVPTDQCWTTYPLCTPLIESDVSLRGPDLQDGFNP